MPSVATAPFMNYGTSAPESCPSSDFPVDFAQFISLTHGVNPVSSGADLHYLLRKTVVQRYSISKVIRMLLIYHLNVEALGLARASSMLSNCDRRVYRAYVTSRRPHWATLVERGALRASRRLSSGFLEARLGARPQEAMASLQHARTVRLLPVARLRKARRELLGGAVFFTCNTCVVDWPKIARADKSPIGVGKRWSSASTPSTVPLESVQAQQPLAPGRPHALSDAARPHRCRRGRRTRQNRRRRRRTSSMRALGFRQP